MVVLTAPAPEASSGATATNRPRWRRFLLPVTYVYAAALVAVTAWLSVIDDTTQSKIVLHVSTNLHNLLRGHFGTLFSSAFVIGDNSGALLIIPLLVSLLALAELRFGAWQVIRIFLAGHIGATLLVALGLWVAVEAGWLPIDITRAEDVGISYGAMALIGAFYALLPSRWRPTWAITWLAVAVAGVVMGRTFTNVGHLLAVVIGLAAGFWALRSHHPTLPKLSWYETVMLVIASVLGYLLLVG
ncbi:rhomboid-like protein [Nocardia sp. NPDC003482]|uniref:rhomboid-like protein n=1 Tax=Nocardia sp. NPDC004068 TaxID=3364303 RepID=UPI0036ADCC51